MGIFNREKKDAQTLEQGTVSVQTGGAATHPFCQLNGYTPLHTVSNRVYDSLREGVPIIDSAINKIIRLMGGFEIVTGDDNLDMQIKEFFDTVNVGGNQLGLQSFVDNYIDQLLTYGTAVGEIICDENGIYALYNSELDALEVKRSNNGIDIEFYNCTSSSPKPIEHPERILFSVLNPRAGELLGTSLLRGLPFVSDVLLKIYQTIGNNWERVGNLRYAVTYKPQSDSTDKAFAKERANQMASAWKEAMASKNSIKDFVAVGDVKVSVIGADNQVLDSEIPVRQMLEQIVAKTGLMPYMFGLNWSTSERMSQQQSDILTTELEAYRRIVTPIIKRIAECYLFSLGEYIKPQIVWDDITLQDETELAKARLYNAQADKLIKETETWENA